MSSRNRITDLGAYVAGISFEELPESVVHTTERCFVDTVGVSIAGATEGAGTIAAEVFSSLSGGGGPATMLAGGDGIPVHDAAFANGVAGHYFDFDDVMTNIHVHPSVTMVPAILAVAEAQRARGEEAITAYVAGLETQYFVAAPINPGHYERGWHATSTYGTFGAAAAVANLLGLDAEETLHALNVAASMAAGLKRNFGSMTKSLHAGHAGYAGLLAAYLAGRGYDATTDAMVGEAGFYDLYSGEEPPDYDAFPEFEDGWVLDDVGIDTKKYPCCYFTHSAIEAAATLTADHDIDPAAVERVLVRASQAAADTLAYERPATGLEAKFSMYYTVASAIARDRVELSTFDDDAVHHGATSDVMDVVEFDVDPDLPYGSHASTVKIELADGTVLERHLSEPPGTPATPLSEEELRTKFEMCAKRAVDDATADSLYEALSTLRDATDLSSIMVPLRS